MAAGMVKGDLEEVVDPGLGMEEDPGALLKRGSLKEGDHSDSLLAPDADSMTGRRLSLFFF